MFDSFRTDVSAMKNIIRQFKAWSPYLNPLQKEEQVGIFCREFIDHHFSLPVQSEEQRRMMRAVAMLALTEYSAEMNHDGSPSILALLGALSEAERFSVDLGIVMKNCFKLCLPDITGRTLGGVGIVNAPQAFANAERRFHEKRAALERCLP